jgi:hypothetical protein
MILKPLSDFLDTDGLKRITLPDLQPSVSVSRSDADDYNVIQDNLIQQSINRQAEVQLESICASEGFKLVSVEVKLDDDYSSIQEILITVKRIAAQSRPFIYIEPRASEEPAEIKKIKNIISEVYNMSLDNIHISETV